MPKQTELSVRELGFFLWGIELGFKLGEKGLNLEATLLEAKDFVTVRHERAANH